jgi:hypothetical protein
VRLASTGRRSRKPRMICLPGSEADADAAEKTSSEETMPLSAPLRLCVDKQRSMKRGDAEAQRRKRARTESDHRKQCFCLCVSAPLR